MNARGYYSRALTFVRIAHREQKRKYTDTAYLFHLLNVAELVSTVNDDLVILTAALLHDVIEDCEVTAEALENLFGEEVAKLVVEVTDVSTLEDGNREERKRLDREHLAGSSPEGATIKLADIIDNCPSVIAFDPAFAKVYLREKRLLLEILTHGDQKLWHLADRILVNAGF